MNHLLLVIVFPLEILISITIMSRTMSKSCSEQRRA